MTENSKRANNDTRGGASETARLRAAFARDPRSLLGRVPGIVVLDKPPGPTSHDMVERLRRALGMKRIGHAGALDPAATGVLVMLLGGATKLFPLTETFDKQYEVTMRLGIATDTLDLDGKVIERREVPPLTRADVENALESFRGAIRQTPPMFSALKHQGVPLHRLARKSVEVHRPARVVEVRELELIELAGDEVRVQLVSSKGFYVRSLAADLGKALGTVGVVAGLRRTRVGPFTLADTRDPDTLRVVPFEG